MRMYVCASNGKSVAAGCTHRVDCRRINTGESRGTGKRTGSSAFASSITACTASTSSIGCTKVFSVGITDLAAALVSLVDRSAASLPKAKRACRRPRGVAGLSRCDIEESSGKIVTVGGAAASIKLTPALVDPVSSKNTSCSASGLNNLCKNFDCARTQKHYWKCTR